MIATFYGFFIFEKKDNILDHYDFCNWNDVGVTATVIQVVKPSWHWTWSYGRLNPEESEFHFIDSKLNVMKIAIYRL